MEAKFGGFLAFVLVQFLVMTTITWHNASEVADLKSQVERLRGDLEAEVEHRSISQYPAETVSVEGEHQEDATGNQDGPSLQREAQEDRLVTLLRPLIQEMVENELDTRLNCCEDHAKNDRGNGTLKLKPKRNTLSPRQVNPTKGQKGTPGPPGPPGPVGPEGKQGVLGRRGVKGDMGTVGEKGERGDTGLSGPSGERGDQGISGEKGDTGLQGPVGEKGEFGLTGPRGEKGDQGDRGVQGSSGQKGDTGPQGAVGETGERGDTGSAGARGEKGEKGDIGLMGPAGGKGDKGDTGQPGEKGEPGPMGEKGNGGIGSYVCGGTSGWTRVAYLDMTNSSHQCPGDMEEVILSGKRVCGRNSNADRSCVSAKFSTNSLQYSQVCGRITGYQYRKMFAFYFYTHPTSFPEAQSIDSWYVDGVSVTHGPPGSREHVWTFANGYNEDGAGTVVCPCASNAHSAIVVPPFVGQDYFCESAISTGTPANRLYSEDPLWDGDGCTVAGNTCCEFNNPPYFTKHLTNSTNNDLEVRACGYRSRSWGTGDTLIELLELYIK